MPEHIPNHPALPPQSDPYEARLRETARAFAYPPTPQIRLAARRPRLSRTRLALVGVLVVLVVAFLLAVPPVRAAVFNWLQIGADRIFLVPSTPTSIPPGETPEITPTPLSSILELSGETTLDAARTQAGFSIRMPAKPPDLGPPAHVYLQEIIAPVVVLVWMEPDRPDKVRMALFETVAQNIIFQKISPESLENTQVNGKPAVWVKAPYLMETLQGTTETTRLIQNGHTLIWTAGPLTYRLETSLELPQAIEIAQSLH